MAEINQDIQTHIVPPGVVAFIVLTFEHDEATTVAQVLSSIGAAIGGAAPPASIIVEGICTAYASQIIENNGPDGVFVEIDCPIVSAIPTSPSVRRIGRRTK